jgi:cystathionine beta-lyase/cystathionine gamma-synthase
MSATASCINAFMNAGDHCVITNCSYGGTNRICREQFIPLGMEFSFVDFTDPKNVEAAIKPNTKLIFSESPTNPTLTIADLSAISAIAKAKGILHVCDSTFATPYIMRPMDHGCDLTIQSLTKYYDGHNMGVGGALIAKTPELYERIKLVQNMHGNIMSPMTAFMMLQSMKTMGLRVKQQSSSAMKIATFLEGHKNVERVLYPGLASHPQKELADRQHRNNLHGTSSDKLLASYVLPHYTHINYCVAIFQEGCFGLTLLEVTKRRYDSWIPSSVPGHCAKTWVRQSRLLQHVPS